MFLNLSDCTHFPALAQILDGRGDCNKLWYIVLPFNGMRLGHAEKARLAKLLDTI